MFSVVPTYVRRRHYRHVCGVSSSFFQPDQSSADNTQLRTPNREQERSMATVRATHECIASTHLASNFFLLLRHLLLHHTTTTAAHLLLPLSLILSTAVDLLRLLLARSARGALLLARRLGVKTLSLARVVRRALGRGLLRTGRALCSGGGSGEAAGEVPAELFVDLLLLGAQDTDAVADCAACGSWGGLARGWDGEGGDGWDGGTSTREGFRDVFELGGRDVAAHDDQHQLVLVGALPCELLWMVLVEMKDEEDRGRGGRELTAAPPSVASAFFGGILMVL